MPDKTSYRDAGVNIDAQDEALREVRRIARGTFTPDVVSDIGLWRRRMGCGDRSLIVEGVGKALALPPERVPHNIERYGNTTAGTLPILYHECVGDGRIKPGMLICFTALGPGLHWGAALYKT